MDFNLHVRDTDSHDLTRAAAGFIDPNGEACILDEDGALCAPGEAGELVILGGADRMVKINGQRVEPMEVEAAIRVLADVVLDVLPRLASGKVDAVALLAGLERG